MLGNLIGPDRTGTVPLGNLYDGIVTGQDDTQIGGDAAGEPNVILFNGGVGIRMNQFGRIGTQNRILRNSIGANGGPGIDLGEDGRTANDARDPDIGPNNFQNFPLITGATTDLVQIAFNGNRNQDFTIRLYSNPSGENEGIRYHGTFAVSTDDDGNTSGAENTLVPNPPIEPGRTVTATATRENGDTSEFSPPRPVS